MNYTLVRNICSEIMYFFYLPYLHFIKRILNVCYKKILKEKLHYNLNYTLKNLSLNITFIYFVIFII